MYLCKDTNKLQESCDQVGSVIIKEIEDLFHSNGYVWNKLYRSEELKETLLLVNNISRKISENDGFSIMLYDEDYELLKRYINASLFEYKKVMIGE